MYFLSIPGEAKRKGGGKKKKNVSKCYEYVAHGNVN